MVYDHLYIQTPPISSLYTPLTPIYSPYPAPLTCLPTIPFHPAGARILSSALSAAIFPQTALTCPLSFRTPTPHRHFSPRSSAYRNPPPVHIMVVFTSEGGFWHSAGQAGQGQPGRGEDPGSAPHVVVRRRMEAVESSLREVGCEQSLLSRPDGSANFMQGNGL